MTEPVVKPRQLGQPCWTDSTLEATVRTVAAMGDESVPRFLATHSPMSHIRLGDTGETVSDGQVFERIARLSARENVVLVHGAPGTGKSHLINWVKLQYDHALQADTLSKVIPVLVRRRTGSLKDALEQLVEQLPERFHKYLEPVRSAIDRISEREARKKLASELHLELGVRWEEAGKERLPRTIRSLPEAFHAEGFGAWLCREGGVIDRNVQRLISPSELHDRDSFPQFTADEFRITDPRQKSPGLNTEKVRNLIDEFAEEPGSAEKAAQLCNDCLRSALRELTGLGNAALSTILRSIRQDLRKEGQRLVLLIEDVSTLSVLDDEVVNAVEPQNDASLCDLTSVLGMTEQAFQRLRDNQYQRIAGSGFILSFPQDASAKSWASDQVETDRFVARYLNATRLTDADIEAIAFHRRSGSDLNISACEACPIRTECHDAFGKVEFGDIVVGLFPFRPGSAPYLLNNLDDDQTGVRQTQRGLLDHITKPVMRYVDELAQGDQRPLALPIRRNSPTGWQAFIETYLGGWSQNDQSRVRLLAEAWTPRTGVSEIASDLQSILKPFSLPDFSSKTGPKKAGTPPSVNRPLPPPPSPPSPDASTQKRLTDLLNRVEDWRSGQKFQSPSDHQTMVIAFLKGALPTDDVRSPAVPARGRLSDANRGSIRFEDSATLSAVAGAVFDFPRTTDTIDLLVALTHFEVAGRKTWEFPDGERYKRMASRWLRKHQDRMLASLDPEGLSTTEPVKLATKFLSMAAMVERRSGLPLDTAMALSHVTSVAASAPPTVLSEPLKRFYQDLPDRRRAVQAFLVNETNLPQGDGGIVIIDPRTITEAITEARTDPTIAPLPDEYFTRYWKSRYVALENLKSWANLPDAIASERDAIGDLVARIDSILALHGVEVGGDYADFPHFIADTHELIEFLKSKLRWTPEDVSFFKKDRIADRASSLASNLARAAAIATGDSDGDILQFNPEDLLTVANVVNRCHEIVMAAHKYADDKLNHLSAEDDPSEVERQMISHLERIAGVQTEAVE